MLVTCGRSLAYDKGYKWQSGVNQLDPFSLDMPLPPEPAFTQRYGDYYIRFQITMHKLYNDMKAAVKWYKAVVAAI